MIIIQKLTHEGAGVVMRDVEVGGGEAGAAEATEARGENQHPHGKRAVAATESQHDE